MNLSDLTFAGQRLWPETKAFLRQMVGINSFTANPEGVNQLGQFVADQFAALDFYPKFAAPAQTGIGNHLILKRAMVPGAPTIALIAHLDTVFPAEEEQRNQFHWREEGDRIYGPGTNDIKGGIALIYLTLALLRAQNQPLFQNTNWVILCNACEETDSRDFGDLCRRELPPDARACLLFEADGGENNDFALVTARNGRATFRVEVHGRGAHAGGQHARGINAIVQLSRVVSQLEKLTNYETGPTVNVGRIAGGTVLNRVPEIASAELEMRAFSSPVFEKARQQILSLAGEGDLRSYDEEAKAAQIEVRVLDETPPWPHNAASDALLAIWQMTGEELGYSVSTERRGGLSDGNVLWNDFPTLDGLGPRGDHGHCSEQDPARGKIQEFVDGTSFVPKAVLNVRALTRLLESAV